MTQRKWYWVGALIFGTMLTIGLATGNMPTRHSGASLRLEPRWYWTFAGIYAAGTMYCVMTALNKRF